MTHFDSLDRALLDRFQRDFPLEPAPFAHIAETLGVDEATILTRFRQLRQSGAVSRIGVTIRTGRGGASTLAALAVPAERLESVAAAVGAFPGVNHCYEREHRFNLWFVVTATTPAALDRVLDAIEAATGLDLLVLPMLEAFHIDLGFPLHWN